MDDAQKGEGRGAALIGNWWREVTRLAEFRVWGLHSIGRGLTGSLILIDNQNFGFSHRVSSMIIDESSQTTWCNDSPMIAR